MESLNNISNINFTFVRHGYGCHNAVSGLVKSDMITKKDGMSFSGKNNIPGRTPMIDPVLTQVGVDASIHNGCIISKILKSLHVINGDGDGDNDNEKIDNIHVIGCSPLIRCMETAYYMSRNWSKPPSKIYVFPFLREIDESSDNKFSINSRIRIDNKPFYSMKSIKEQKKYLESLGILNFFDFSFVEMSDKERKEPGDISNFIKWFVNFFIKKRKLSETLNAFIVTHAGVLSDFVNNTEGFINNSGFVINTQYDNNKNKVQVNKYVSLNDFLSLFNFYKNYNITNKKEYYCPSNRCEELCTIAKGNHDKEIKHININCDINDDDNIPSLLKMVNL
jgi:hypothetical protein